MLIFFKVSAPRAIRKTGGKIWLTYKERLKRTEMMIRKSNERINYDIDHNNVCRWNKIFLFKVYMKEELFNIFVTRVYLTVCFYHVTCAFQSEPTLYSSLNFKELFPRNKRGTYLNVCVRNEWLWVGILLQPLGFIFDGIFSTLAQRRMTFFVLHLFSTEVCLLVS